MNATNIVKSNMFPESWIWNLAFLKYRKHKINLIISYWYLTTVSYPDSYKNDLVINKTILICRINFKTIPKENYLLKNKKMRNLYLSIILLAIAVVVCEVNAYPIPDSQQEENLDIEIRNLLRVILSDERVESRIKEVLGLSQDQNIDFSLLEQYYRNNINHIYDLVYGKQEDHEDYEDQNDHEDYEDQNDHEDYGDNIIYVEPIKVCD